ASITSEAGEERAVTQLYERSRACGVELGPQFQALRRVWRRGSTAWGEVILDDMLQHDAGRYHLHPVLLDGAFQAMGAVFTDHSEFALHVPVAVDALRVWRRSDATCWAQVRVAAKETGEQRGLCVDVKVLSAGGRIVAEIERLQLARTTRERLLAANASEFSD